MHLNYSFSYFTPPPHDHSLLSHLHHNQNYSVSNFKARVWRHSSHLTKHVLSHSTRVGWRSLVKWNPEVALPTYSFLHWELCWCQDALRSAVSSQTVELCVEPPEEQRRPGLLLGSPTRDMNKLCGLLDVCSGESVWEQHTAQTTSSEHSQKSVGTRTHTHTKGIITRWQRESLLFACVNMSQGADEHSQRGSTQNSQLSGQLCGRKTKCVTMAKSFFQYGKTGFSVWSVRVTVKKVSSSSAALRIGAETANNLSVTIWRWHWMLAFLKPGVSGSEER